MKKPFYLISGIIGVIYLLNPGAGIIELIPDVWPVIGNLDEYAAAALVIASLNFFGKNCFGKNKKNKENHDSNASIENPENTGI